MDFAPYCIERFTGDMIAFIAQALLIFVRTRQTGKPMSISNNTGATLNSYELHKGAHHDGIKSCGFWI
jgi:hypothetical protein